MEVVLLAPSERRAWIVPRWHELVALTGSTWWPLLRSPRFLLLLCGIGMVGGMLVGLDLGHRYAMLEDDPANWRFSLSEEGGLGECWEYVLSAATATALLRLWARTRCSVYAASAAVFAWVLLDNAVELHERGGTALAPFFRWLGAGVLAPDVGELVVFAAAGLAIIALIFPSVRHGIGRDAVLALAPVACVFGAAFFGVGADFVHSEVHSLASENLADQVLGFIEDGGELAMLSLAAALALAIPMPPKRQD